MKDRWSWFNEVSQNLIGLAVVAAYLYMVLKSMDTPIELKGFVAAILIFYGYKTYKSVNGGSPK